MVKEPLIRIAGVQMDVVWGAPEANLAAMEARLAEAAGAGARLVVFPECAVTGYCFESRAEAWTLAEAIPGPSVQRLAAACQQHQVSAVFGMLERAGEQLYNVSVLLAPEGLVHVYRKAHLPHLGVDRFVAPGDRPFQAHQASGIRVGMNICYDASFPEAARCLALDGAELIALPTNWPPGSQCAAACLINARALENHVYVAAVNRVGEERGFEFIGHSRICDPLGNTLAEAPHREPIILYADINPQLARQKQIVRVPERHFIDRFADRRPDLYGPVTAPLPGAAGDECR